MAYSDEGRRFWHIDLTTRAGARNAAAQGGTACFVFCAMAVLGAIFFGGLKGFGTVEGLAAAAGALFEALIALVAGLRLRAGKGAFWGMAVAVLAALEMIGKVLAFSIGGLVIVGVILIMIIQGIRGALALKNQPRFEDDDIDVFA